MEKNELNQPKPAMEYRLCDLPVSQRPRELMERFGVDKVEDEVLLAILLRSGTRGLNVLEIARCLLRRYGSLTELAAASADELRGPGLGPVKAQVLKAALELGRRLAEEKLEDSPRIRAPADVASILREKARVLKTETFWVLLLNTKNRLQGEPVVVTRGLLNASLVHPREVFRPAIHASCAAIILAHNHPSGDPAPSPEDLKITRELVEAGKVLLIRVLDHIILGRARGTEAEYISIRENGLVEFE